MNEMASITPPWNYPCGSAQFSDSLRRWKPAVEQAQHRGSFDRELTVRHYPRVLITLWLPTSMLFVLCVVVEILEMLHRLTPVRAVEQ